MLAVLRISNLAIIDYSEIEFSSGLNVLTGETGAGKSIILKAIELLSGRRASAAVLRSGCDRCEIEALFYLRPETRAKLHELFDELTDIIVDEELLIRRVIESTGRSKIYLNGCLSTSNLLQRISTYLFDITGQHIKQNLLDESTHLDLLDDFGTPQELLDKCAKQYQKFANAKRALDSFKSNTQEQALYFARIRSERDELGEAALEDGERERLENDLARLSNVEHLAESVNTALDSIDSSDGGLEAEIKKLLLLIERAYRVDASLKESFELTESASLQLAEVRILLSDYAASLDADPERLEEIRSRIAEIARLERKYSKTESELIAYYARISSELDEFDAGAFDEKALSERLEEERVKLSAIEDDLSRKRKKTAKSLAAKVEQDLAELGMKKARFAVSLDKSPSHLKGADHAAFSLAANPGEPFQPLAKVASGGELSRILLVLKTLLNTKLNAETQIFDEIDSGIGGAIAQSVGERLLLVAKNSQVILITHAPQIAALADTQYLVEKSTSKKRTVSRIMPLDEKQRVRQIASMLAGKNVSSQFEESAKALLKTRKKLGSSAA